MANLTIVFGTQPHSSKLLLPPHAACYCLPLFQLNLILFSNILRTLNGLPPRTLSYLQSLYPLLLSFQMIKWDGWVRKGHGYPPFCKRRDRTTGEVLGGWGGVEGSIKAKERVGRPWNVLGFFQG